MAISELEIKRCEKALEKFLEQRRPPAHIHSQVDLAYRISGQSVESLLDAPKPEVAQLFSSSAGAAF